MPPAYSLRQEGEQEGRDPDERPDGHVAEPEEQQPTEATLADGAGIEVGEGRDGGQHHRSHHQRPHADEGREAEAHGAGHLPHAVGSDDRPGGRRCGNEQQHDRLGRDAGEERARECAVARGHVSRSS
ncbi:MAG: hypothetical protein U5Q44_01110 [Dehalococcoidia bacterium]|nr:hypothetical protein [Dehalococcoidia bacterium]